MLAQTLRARRFPSKEYWPGLNCGWLFKSTQINATVNIKENLSCCENENSIKCKFDLKNYVNEFDVNEVREN